MSFSRRFVSSSARCFSRSDLACSALLAEKVHDAGVGENPEVEVRKRPHALGVAVLAAFEENGDGVGHRVFDESFSGDLPDPLFSAGLELGEQIDRGGWKLSGHGGGGVWSRLSVTG